MTLQEDLDRWQEAGLLEPAQALRIRDHEAARAAAPAAPAAPPGPGAFARLEVSLTEVVAYAGSIAVLVGLGFLLGFQGEQLGGAGRLAVYALVTAAALGVGLLFEPRSSRPPVRRARASALLLGAAGVFALVAEAATDLHLLTQPARYAGGDLDQSGNLMLAGVASALVAGLLFWWVRALLLGVATAAAAYSAAGFFVSWRHGGDAWTNEAAYCAAAVLVAAATELVRRRGGGRWAVEAAAFAALAPPALAALTFAPYGSQGLELVLFGGALAAFASAAAVSRRSPGYGVAAGLGLFSFSSTVARHFSAEPWYLLLLLGVSAVLLTHAERLVRQRRTGGALELYRCLAVLPPVLPGLALVPSGSAAAVPLALVGLLSVAASAAAVWRHSSGFAVGSGIGLAAFLIAVPAFLYDQAWLAALDIAAAAGTIVFHVERFRRLGSHGFWLEALAFAGLMTPIGYGLSLASGPSQVAFEALAGLIAAAAFAVAVARSSRGYAVAGGVGLFAVTLTVGFRHFSDSLGFAGVLVAAGLVLIGIAFALARLLPRLRAGGGQLGGGGVDLGQENG